MNPAAIPAATAGGILVIFFKDARSRRNSCREILRGRSCDSDSKHCILVVGVGSQGCARRIFRQAAGCEAGE
jgi:hypothetical protein